MSPMVKLPLTVELGLLGFLHERPMHGYELHQILSEAAELGLVWHLKQSQLYALLGRLEDEELVTAIIEPQGSRAPRKIFQLTEAGKDAYNEWVRSPVAHGRDVRIEFLAKLYFARRHGPHLASQLIASQREICLTSLQELQRQAEGLGQQHPYDWLVLQFRIGQLEAILRWLDLCANLAAEPLLRSE